MGSAVASTRVLTCRPTAQITAPLCPRQRVLPARPGYRTRTHGHGCGRGGLARIRNLPKMSTNASEAL